MTDTYPKLPVRLADYGVGERMEEEMRKAGLTVPARTIVRTNDGAFTLLSADGDNLLTVHPSRPRKRKERYDFDDATGLAFARRLVRLINNADDLLAALKRMVEGYADDCSMDDQPTMVREAMLVIARAEGRS